MLGGVRVPGGGDGARDAIELVKVRGRAEAKAADEQHVGRLIDHGKREVPGALDGAAGEALLVNPSPRPAAARA